MMIVSAMPMMKPFITGSEMKLARNPTSHLGVRCVRREPGPG
jgi:hypothetical protein